MPSHLHWALGHATQIRTSPPDLPPPSLHPLPHLSSLPPPSLAPSPLLFHIFPFSAFIPRADLIKQIYRWASVELEQNGPETIGMPARVQPMDVDGVTIGLYLTLLRRDPITGQCAPDGYIRAYLPRVSSPDNARPQ